MTTMQNSLSRPKMESVDLSRGRLSWRRRLVDRSGTTAMAASLLVALVPLGFVIFEVVSRGAGVMSLDFLTAEIPRNYRRPGPGMGPAIMGTLLITGIAALMSIPLGIFGAIYLNEYGKKSRLASFIRSMSDVMTGVPSIMMGLFIYLTWVLAVGQKNGFGGALALACLMLPIVIRSSEEMLRLVPDELRQGSAALGARKWRTTLTVVVPSALPGLISGSLLAIARAAGETAPIVVTTGIIFATNTDMFNGGNTTLAAQIFRNASQPFAASVDRAWGAALTLVVIVLLFTILSRLIASRFATSRS
ncbi:MAG TPA: phosphate ABC transporter permease PstA [Candidatus Stackebrandtia faecavium]|nr:phosphate ABC transporter permease PstA [Candidatus Stackebrandtia faecavium]